MIGEHTRPRREAFHAPAATGDAHTVRRFARPEDLTAAVARQLPEAPYPARPAANNDPREGTVERPVKKGWAHRAQLVLFAVNGLNVFALGLLIQVLLVRYAGWGHVASYIAPTVL